MESRTVTVTAAYLATVPAANLLTTHIGTIPVGFGQAAPAGALAIGVSFALRDLVHSWAGKPTALAAIATGSLLAYLIATPSLAIASATAFAVAELADTAIYGPLRERGMLRAVAASSAVGLIIDSLLFVWLAFGSLDLAPGLILAKAYVTATAIAARATQSSLREQA